MIVPEITIFVRHSSRCRHKGKPFYKSCDCRKHLRYSYRGRQTTVSAKTRSWQTAAEVRHDLEERFSNSAAGAQSSSAERRESRATVARAVELFLVDKQSQGIDSTAYKKHVRELGRFAEHCSRSGLLFVDEIRLDVLTLYRASWSGQYASSRTRSKVQERLRGFLRYCYEAGMLSQVPRLSPIKVTAAPTLPLSESEYQRLLDAIDREFDEDKAY
jgi:integrase/recombinase XerD